MPGQVFKDIRELKKQLDRWGYSIFAVSGGFDPIHIGHVRYITSAAEKCQKGVPGNNFWNPGVLVVIVNSDGFLTRKKGYSFMPIEERMEVLAAIEGVDFVTCWDDGTQTVIGALEILRPEYFLKGGDRSDPESVPEYSTCDKIGCEVIFDVGGKEKAQSSSELVRQYENIRLKNKKPEDA